MDQKKIKLGILGAGRFARRRLLPQIEKIPNFELFALHNRTLSKAKDLALEYNTPNFTDSEDQLFNSYGLDAVIICSPNYQHEKQIQAALDKNLAVFVEKPFTTDFEGAIRILNTLKAEDTLLVGHCYRFKNALNKAKRFLQEGHLGELISLNICMNMNIPKEGWRFQNRFGGGAASELGIHVVDSIRFLTGLEFQSVQAIGEHLLDDENEPVDISIHALGELEHHVPVTFSFSFNSPYKTDLTLSGTKGELQGSYILRGDADGKERLIFKDLDENQTSLPLTKQNIYFEELKHFEEVISGANPQITAESGAQNLEVIEAIKRSIETKKREELGSSLFELEKN